MKFTAGVAAATCLLSQASGSKLSDDLANNKNRPVTKVINLLKDMLDQLEKEGEKDQEVYDKMACWCETNDKEKTKSIADAEARIEDLNTAIEEHTANSARLSNEIKVLEKEVAKNQDALSKATSLREKQLAEFNGEEKDVLQSISALKAAITVLGKHQEGGSLLQVSKTLKHTLVKHDKLLQGVLKPSERQAALSFIQAAPGMGQSYAPQSGQIFGILEQMKETFETNLSASQKEEQENQKAYEDLKAAKDEEIAAGQSQIDMKTEELATTDAKKAQADEDLKDTEASLAADEEFLAMLKEKCANTDKEWEERQATRTLEMKACSEALTVLSSDDAHELFGKTFNPASLLQETATAKLSVRRQQAAKVLVTVAKKVNNPRFAALALSVRLDAFEKVKKAIDDMIAALNKEKADEIKHRDFCIEEFNTNQLETERKEREKQDLTAKIEDLTMTIDELSKAINTLSAEVAEMQVQMKRAGEDREKQNADFQTTVAEQRGAAKLLQAALDILANFYAKGAFVQQPAGFEEYKKNEAAGGVIGMIKTIIADTKKMEAEAIRAEEDSQKAYEDFVKETNASIETKNKDIANKSEEKAKAEADNVEAKEGKENTETDLEQLSNYNAELHSSCDFIMKNFDVRQTARDEEVDALKQAKAILSGAK